jgi:DNA-binding transcriptional MocR family regulator
MKYNILLIEDDYFSSLSIEVKNGYATVIHSTFIMSYVKSIGL